MGDFVCKECGREFGSRKGFHVHVRTHCDMIGEYYVRHYGKRDLFTGDLLQFRKYDQYFGDEFNTFDNFVSWMRITSDEEVKRMLVEKVRDRFEKKGIKASPSTLFYQLSLLPDVHTFRKYWGSYAAFLEEVGVENVYCDNLPEDFWDGELPEDMCVFVDTRERYPFEYKNSCVNKLDFGDYTVGGEYYSRTFVDRKSAADFKQTFGKDILRFRREMDRCVQFNSYMFVVVESSVLRIEEENGRGTFKSNLQYVWHNVRELVSDYPRNIQVVFAHNRKGAEKITPKILYHGEALWGVDVQYHVDSKIHGDVQRGQQVNI